MRLIDSDALLNDMGKRYCKPCRADKKDYNGVKCRACWVGDAIGEIDGATTIGTEACAHYFKCSNCKYTVPYRKAVLISGKREYNYCPHCGARMDVKKEG